MRSPGFRIGASVVAMVAIVGVASFAAIVRPWETKPSCPIAADGFEIVERRTATPTHWTPGGSSTP